MEYKQGIWAKLRMTTFFQQINSMIPSLAWDATVSIVIAYGEELHQFGTGIVLKVANDLFLVTAAHVVQLANERDNALCITVGHSFTQVYGNWICSSENDPTDVAILRLPAAVAQKLEKAACVHLQDVDFNPNLSRGIFCLCGFPSAQSKPSTPMNPTLQSRPLQYVTYAYEGDTYALGNYQEKYHLLLNADEEGEELNGAPAYFRDRDGHLLRFPKDLGGISGCSVWRIGTQDEPVTNWWKSRPKIVAVQTSVYPERKIIKATRWHAVSTFLYEAYPDLRPSMSLWYVEY